MALQKLKEKGIPAKNLIYSSIGLVIFGLIAINFVLNFFWQESLINDLRKRLINYQISEAKRAAESIERYVEKELREIENLAVDIASLKENKEIVESFISRFLNEHFMVKEISIINLEGREEGRYSKKEIFLPKKSRDFSFLEEFERAKKGEVYISPVNFSDSGEPFVVISLPIRKLEIQEPQAVLRALVDLQEAWGEVIERKIGKSGRVSVVDDKGMLIADPSPSRVFKKTNLLDLPPTKAVLKGDVFFGSKYFNEKGKEVIGVGAPIKFGDLKWGVIVEQDLEEIEEPFKPITRLIILSFLSGLLIVGILSWLLVVINRADKQLIERYEAWERAQASLAEARDVLEIRVRARTKELQELVERQEEIIKERTKELQEKIAELEKFQKIAIGRELRMVELKREIERLKKELEKYKKP
jgi:hypothetical protein